MRTRGEGDPWWSGYLLAVVATASVGLVRYALSGVLGEAAPTIPFVVPVILAAWYGGLRPGLLATALGALVGNYLFVPPNYSLSIDGVAEAVALGLFVVCGVMISGLCEALHAARRRVEAEAGRARREADERGKAEERLRVTLLSIGDGLITTDDSGRVVALNPVAESLTGWASTDAAGQPLEEVFRIVNEESRQPVENPLLRALKEGAIVGLANHTVLIAKGGTERPIDDSAAPVRDGEGRVVGAVLVFRDISERKRIEKVQEEAHRQIATPLESISDGFMRFDRGWRIVYVNAEAERINHRPRAELLGKSHWELFPATVGTMLEAEFRRAVADQVTVELENYYEPWGRWFEIKGYPSPDGGLAIYFRDITDRKKALDDLRQSEARFRAGIEAVSSLVWTNNARGEMTGEQFGWGNFTGQDRASYQGYGWSRAVHPDDAQPTLDAWNEAVAGKKTFVFEHRVRRSDGQWRLCSVRAVPVFDGRGEVAEWVGVHTDITDQKRGEEERQRLASIVENSPDYIGISDIHGNPLYGNRAAMELVGLDDSEQVRQSKIVDYFVPEQRKFVEEVVLPAVLKDGRWSGELTFRHFRTGAAIPVLYDLFRVDDPTTGRPINLATVTRDITERKAAEEALRENERRLRFVMDSMPQKIFTATPAGDVDYFNPIWMGFTGLSFEQIRGWGWTQFIHPDDVAENVRVWRHAVDIGEPFQFEHRFRRHDGEYRWHTSRALPMQDGAGRVVLWIGSDTDIHDVKRAEQTARFVAGVGAALADLTDPASTMQKVASMSVPHFADWCAVDMADEDGRHRRVGVMHADPVKLRAYRELLERYPPRTDDRHGILHVLRTGEPDLVEDIPDSLLAAGAHDEEHLRLLRGMGLKSHVLVPIRSHGRTVGVLTFITAESGRRYGHADLEVALDLARRAAVAVQNADLYQALRDADRRKDEFLATLAHELRNPLAPIRNGLQVMRLAKGNGEAVEQSRTMMERQLDQMVRLVDDLMDVSRISRGKLELKTERVLLAAVVNSAVETSRPLVEQMGHELTVKLPNHPVVVEADLTRLAQVFLNLLNNAAKYSDRGGHIRLTAERQGSDVVVSVKDTGIGIAADQLPRIFEMFSQVDRSLEKAQGGLGIGLTLVKRLVEMHGGGIEAKSEGPGKGSEFVVRLPVATEATVPQKADERQEGDMKSTLRILIVDDNRDSADSLGMMLRVMGNDTRTAYDGEEAVAAAVEYRPDVILLDIGLPKLNGYEACRRIRQQADGKKLVIVAQTGWGQDEDRQRTHDAGFDHHLVKPVDPSALMKLLAGLSEAARM